MIRFENLEKYIAEVWETQGALAEKLKVSKQTVSQWVNRRSRITHDYQKALRELKPPYDGPFPDVTEGVTREDLELLRQDLRAHQGWVLEEVRKELGDQEVRMMAALQEILRTLLSGPGNPKPKA